MPSVDRTTYSTDEQQALLRIAFDAIRHGLHTRHAPPAIEATHYPLTLQQSAACFVTLTLGGELRGCIGSLQAHRPLVADVAANAHAAAFRDPRFAPLSALELTHIDCHISILGPPQPMCFDSEAGLLHQLRPGIDGLILEEAGGQRATFLPAVWASLPTPALFVQQLKLKAGLSVSHWSATLRAWRYQTHGFEGQFPADY
ncbi:MAG: AmmeMemoRadiSam system protein A [Gammaproteobacteria bacterium]|nr:AmmeMemoRadiSam system protein A [Gammaproteobacteria bacterium]